MGFDLTVRGTRDFYPEIQHQLSHITDVWRKTALAYGFEEFEGPVIETLELYRIKSGDEIVGQLYTFPDKGGRELALRPELTPTLARMVSKIQNEVPKPIKWFSIPRCMRYEKPQKGRLREFFQFNVDIIGEEEESADLEIISVAVDSLLNLGLTEKDFVVKINNRDFVIGLIQQAGIGETEAASLFKIIDGARKEGEQATLAEMEKLNLSEPQREVVHSYLSIRTAEDLISSKENSPGRENLLRLFALIEASGLRVFCEFDPSIFRGLDYYTGAVFEIFDRGGKMRAICGGGRYNHLLREFSSVDIPACGFGMGDVVLGEVLREKGLIPPYSKKVDYFIVRVSDGELRLMFDIARALRKKGHSVEYAYKLVPVKKQMARASKAQAAKALILGEQELSRGEVVEKDLASGNESRIPVASLLK